MNLLVLRRNAGLATTFSGCKAPDMVGSVFTPSKADLTKAARFGPSNDRSFPPADMDGFLNLVLPRPLFFSSFLFESFLFKSECWFQFGVERLSVGLEICLGGGRGAVRGDSKGNEIEAGDRLGTVIASGRFVGVGGAARGDSNGSIRAGFCVGVLGSVGKAVVKSSSPMLCGLGVGDGILLLSSELIL